MFPSSYDVVDPITASYPPHLATSLDTLALLPRKFASLVAYMPILMPPATSSLLQPRTYHSWGPPLTPSHTFAATSSMVPTTALRAPVLHCSFQPPEPLSTLAPGDPRLHDLVIQLSHTLSRSSTTELRSDLPHTLADLADRLAHQQAGIDDFLRALDGSAYTRLGLLPSDALRKTSRYMDGCSVHGASGACSQTMRGLACDSELPRASDF